MDPDVLLLATDAGQELSQLELATIAAARHHNTQLIIALTKIDLHPHWRRILAVNLEHLRRAGLSVPVMPVSARLYELGRQRNEGSLSNESGIVSCSTTSTGPPPVPGRCTCARGPWPPWSTPPTTSRRAAVSTSSSPTRSARRAMSN
jgi:hypothetical protein